MFCRLNRTRASSSRPPIRILPWTPVLVDGALELVRRFSVGLGGLLAGHFLEWISLSISFFERSLSLGIDSHQVALGPEHSAARLDHQLCRALARHVQHRGSPPLCSV